MPVQLRRTLYRLSRHDRIMLHIHVHRLLIRHQLRRLWPFPRIVSLPLVGTVCMFVALLFLPTQPTSVVAAVGAGAVSAVVIDKFLATVL